MMFLDASVLVAVLAREPGYEDILTAISNAGSSLIVSPLVRFEATIALARIKAGAAPRSTSTKSEFIVAAKDIVDEFLSELETAERHINSDVADGAIKAAATYGKVVGHKAALNMGDCFSYACAKAQNVSLLYKGNDFAQTDLA